ncbi:hypothetical protein HPB51_008762 [Rhipicephalus microplus]|uniref:Receptor ligand binding region domain-containing protein n=1 Tax=Rhipicephalus microplus TaxID=6941 RepID=A0A9J6EG65_RHIMP|nr:hypothetical protein HPB51_008762 [Rhipicephalus microplus]
MDGAHLLSVLLCLAAFLQYASPLQPNEKVETGVQNLKSLYIAAVFPMKGHGGWLGGQGCLPAALMALEDVNKRSDLLIGYKLEIDWRDSQTGEDLEARCKEAHIEIVTRQSFLTDPTDAVKNLVRQDARIIVGMFYVAAARRVFCEAYKQNVFGKQYVWLLIGWYEDGWYTVQDKGHNCTTEQMKEALEGHFTTEALMLNQGSQETISGMGFVAFSAKGDRMAWTLIEQMIDGNYVKIGYFDTQTDNLTILNQEKWTDGKPPQDRTIIVRVHRKVSLSLFAGMCAVAFIGVVWAVGLLIFNWIFRHSSETFIRLKHRKGLEVRAPAS